MGSQIPQGAGIAFAHKYRKEPNVCVTMFGDGAANQARAHGDMRVVPLIHFPALSCGAQLALVHGGVRAVPMIHFSAFSCGVQLALEVHDVLALLCLAMVGPAKSFWGCAAALCLIASLRMRRGLTSQEQLLLLRRARCTRR